MELVKPRRMAEGDTIGLIAPSQSAAYIEPRVWQIGLDRLRSLGFEVKVGEHVMERTGHTAGSVENRLADLTDFLEDEDVAAIMTVFGGYSSNQLLHHIDYDLVRKARKFFVGYSDITAMNNAFLSKAGLASFSGPAFVTFCQPDLPRYTIDRFMELARGDEDVVTVRASDEWAEDLWFEKEDLGPREWRMNTGWRVINGGKVSGKAVGGNLNTLLLLSGTEFWPDLDGAVLFLEEDDHESPATIDRNLTHLKHLGVFDQISGLVLGRFPSAVGFDVKDDLESIITNLAIDEQVPIVCDVDLSHTDPLMTVPLGIKTELDCQEGCIRFLEKAVTER